MGKEKRKLKIEIEELENGVEVIAKMGWRKNKRYVARSSSDLGDVLRKIGTEFYDRLLILT